MWIHGDEHKRTTEEVSKANTDDVRTGEFRDLWEQSGRNLLTIPSASGIQVA